MFRYVIPAPLLGQLVRNGGHILGLNCRIGRTTSECGSHCTRFLLWFALFLKSNCVIIVTVRDLGGTTQWAQLELSG